MEALIVEPYHTGSHASWMEGLVRHSRHSWTAVTLPGRWWRWRMRGGAVTVAEECARLAEGGYRPEALLVSGMIDLPLLLALLPREWGRIPTALYLHETQLTYPESPQLRPDLSYAYTNWASALAADQVFFNSGYHRDVFFERLRPFLRGFPDLRQDGRIDEVAARSTVLPVGVETSWIGSRDPKGSPPLVLWNHRWEHDKAPSVFLEAVVRLAADGHSFRLALCGENFTNEPTEFRNAARRLGDRVVAFGFASTERYRRLVMDSSVVVSTALQEFFGVSVVEAVAAGAFPVLPDRLSYPWLIPPAFHAEVLYADGRLIDRMADVLSGTVPGDERRRWALADEMRRCFGWESVIGAYDDALAALAERQHR